MDTSRFVVMDRAGGLANFSLVADELGLVKVFNTFTEAILYAQERLRIYQIFALDENNLMFNMVAEEANVYC